MAYLHKRKLYHGFLTSKNCLVDDRWGVKVGDFGLAILRSPTTQKRGAEDSGFSPLEGHAPLPKVYMGPESKEKEAGIFSWHGDVYSFGVILREIAGTLDPFAEIECRSVSRVGSFMKHDPLIGSNPNSESPLLQTLESESSSQYESLLLECTKREASTRPSFKSIRKMLKKLSRPYKRDHVDMMMNMMEDYSKLLENLVSRKAIQCELERQRREHLMFSQIPYQLAEIHKMNGYVNSLEKFPRCTVLSAKIVGISELDSSLVPMKDVATFMSHLLTALKSVINNDKLYQVETTKDSLVLVAGLQESAFTQHVESICHATLKMRAEAESVIQNKAYSAINGHVCIQVGIHSGPVFAGVLGSEENKIWHYGVYGETVDIATELATTATSSSIDFMKVQVSDESRVLMNKAKAKIFFVERHIKVNLNTRGGPTKTFWLKGVVKCPGTAMRQRSLPEEPEPWSKTKVYRRSQSLNMNDEDLSNGSSFRLRRNYKERDHKQKCELSIIIPSSDESREDNVYPNVFQTIISESNSTSTPSVNSSHCQSFCSSNDVFESQDIPVMEPLSRSVSSSLPSSNSITFCKPTLPIENAIVVSLNAPLSASKRLESGKPPRPKRKVREVRPRSLSIPFIDGRPKSPMKNHSDSSDSGYEGPSFKLKRFSAIKTLSLKQMP